jgi:hypothetical protein
MSESAEYVIELGVEGLLSSVLQRLEKDLTISGDLKVMALGTLDLDVWSWEDGDPARDILDEVLLRLRAFQEMHRQIADGEPLGDVADWAQEGFLQVVEMQRQNETELVAVYQARIEADIQRRQAEMDRRNAQNSDG